MMFHGKSTSRGTRPGHHNGVAGNCQRGVWSFSQDPAVHQIINWSRASNNCPGSNDGARFNDGTLINTTVATNQNIVFDDHRHGSNGLEHAANLASSTEMHPLANLRAGTHQSVRVHHRLIVHVSTGVNVHRWHQSNVVA